MLITKQYQQKFFLKNKIFIINLYLLSIKLFVNTIYFFNFCVILYKNTKVNRPELFLLLTKIIKSQKKNSEQTKQKMHQ